MKNVIAIILIGLFGGFAQAQELIEKKILKYEAPDVVSGLEAVEIPFDFSKYKLKKRIPATLKDEQIVRIDLVYSEFKSNPEFDQAELNNKRLAAFIADFSDEENEMIEWRAIGQTEGDNSKSARDLFHGFVVYYRPKPTEETMKKEMDFLDEFVLEGKRDTPKKLEKTTATKLIPNIISTDNIKADASDKAIPVVFDEFLTLPEEGCYHLEQFTKVTSTKESNRIMDSLTKVPNYGGANCYWTGDPKIEVAERIYTVAVLDADCESAYSYSPWGMDSPEYGVVQEVFERFPAWRNSLIVMDVTGSMSPYIAKTMAWIKDSQRAKDVDGFVFFNDGNMTPDSEKRTGKVGGVYETPNSDFKSVYSQMKNTMSKGGGGDCPENNVEAAIIGIKDYPNADEIVMVADNWATPRDLSLTKNLEKPVHVILCGAGYGVNVDYIQLAYETGGSVHTIEEDLDTRSIEPGKTFKLGRFYYTLLDGKLIQAEHK